MEEYVLEYYTTDEWAKKYNDKADDEIFNFIFSSILEDLNAPIYAGGISCIYEEFKPLLKDTPKGAKFVVIKNNLPK